MNQYDQSRATTSGAALGYATPPTPADSSPSRIRDGVTHGEQVLSSLHEAISALESRLETVLQPQPPSVQSNAGNKPVGPPASHLLGRVLIANEGFEAAVARLQELARRIEV